MSKKRVRILALLIVSFFVVAGGCTPQSKPFPNQGQTEMLPNEIPQVGGQRLSSLTQEKGISDIQRSNRMTEQLATIENVRRASVIINGSTAIVGIEFTDKSNNVIANGVNKFINSINTRKLVPQPSPNINTSKQTGSPDATKLNINSTISPGDNSFINIENSDSEINMLIVKAAKGLDSSINKVLVTTETDIIDNIQRLDNKITSEINDISNLISSNSKK